MTVKEWIENKKKTVTLNEVVSNLESLIEYAWESGYNKRDLDKEYKGDYAGESDDPWIGDIMFCEKAIELLNDLVNHIENFEDDNANEVLITLGVRKQNS